MDIAAKILVSLVGILHVWFMVLESFLWTRPIGLKTFGMNQEKANITKVLAQNQGLYNGFLAAGLFWGTYTGDFKINVFFLSCVIMAGVVGALTVSRRILFIQSLPALTALIFVFLASNS